MKKTFFLFVFFQCMLAVHAQEIIITDTAGKAVESAALLLTDAEGKKHFHVSDKNGNIKLNENMAFPVRIEISCLGYFPVSLILNRKEPAQIIRLQRKTYNLSGLVVTGQMAPRSVNEIMQDATVISAEKIQSLSATSLEQVMQFQTAAFIARDAVLGSNLSLRGLSGHNIKYLIDGVPVIGRMNGFIDLSQLNVGNAERIEIINGPMAVHYGSDAHGGVVNIITKDPARNQTLAEVYGQAETAGWYHTGASASYSAGSSSIGINAGRIFFEGWNDGSEKRWKAWKPKTQYHAGMKASHSLRNTRIGYQAVLLLERLVNKGEPRITPYYAYALDEYYRTGRITHLISAEHSFGHASVLKSSLAGSWFKRIKNRYRKDMVTLQDGLTGATDQDTSSFQSWNFRAEWNHRKSDKTSFQQGMEFNSETAEGKRTGGRHRFSETAVYASLALDLTPDFSIQPAIRASYYSISEKMKIIPAFSLRYDLRSGCFLRANYSSGYRLPSLKELYLDFRDINHNLTGNPRLVAESSHNGTLSFYAEKKAGSVTLSFSPQLFYSGIQNMITLAQVSASSGLYSYVNLGRYETHGAVFNFSLIHQSVSFQPAISITAVKDESENGRRFRYVAGMNSSLIHDWRTTGIRTACFISLTGKTPVYLKDGSGQIQTVYRNQFMLADVTVSRSFLRNRISVQTGIKNLLNVTRLEGFGTNGVHGSSENPVAGTGRSYFVKISVSTGK